MNNISDAIKIIYPKLQSNFTDIICGMSTRRGGISKPPLDLNLSFNVGDEKENVLENRKRFFGAMGIPLANVAFTNQTHGVKIESVGMPGVYDECDAMVSNLKNIFLSITIADCVPILLFDPMTKTFASVHAGWKGSKFRILEETINLMRTTYNVSPEHIHTFIGPSASVCCYEVGQEVASSFEKKYISSGNASNPHLNLKQFNKDILLSNGVLEHNIEVSEHCTICNAYLFHSYRRDGSKSGRMMAVIGLDNGK